MMFMIAVLGYAVFVGRGPLVKGKKRTPFDDEMSPAQREEDFIGRKLQSELASGNHQAVIKLWHRLKSLDGAAPPGCFPGVVRTIQKLGKSSDEILAELRSAFDCNAALAEGLAELLESLRRSNEAGAKNDALISGVAKLLEDPHAAKGTPTLKTAVDPRLKEVTAALRQGKLDVPKLEAVGVQMTTQTLDELLCEAGRRKDAAMFRQLYLLAGAASISKRPQTLEAFIKGLASDSATVHALFDEVKCQEEVPESLWVSLLVACATNRDAKLAR